MDISAVNPTESTAGLPERSETKCLPQESHVQVAGVGVGQQESRSRRQRKQERTHSSLLHKRLFSTGLSGKERQSAFTAPPGPPRLSVTTAPQCHQSVRFRVRKETLRLRRPHGLARTENCVLMSLLPGGVSASPSMPAGPAFTLQ